MGENMKKKEMPAVWFSLKKPFHCKSEQPDVYDPKNRKQLGASLTKKTCRSGCSRSIANLKGVINGGRRHLEKPPTCSPRSIASREFLNPTTHQVILDNSKRELKIAGSGGFHGGSNGGGGGSTFVGTPGPGGHPTMRYFNPSLRNSATPHRKSAHLLTEREGFGNGGSAILDGGNGCSPSYKRASFEKDPNETNGNGVAWHKCGELFVKWEALESHRFSSHAVTELMESDLSRKIVEIICRSSDNVRIDRVLKIHNMQKTLTRFEDYRETVKLKASKLPKKHPRCLADGNELLRFYGTNLACSLGLNGSSSLCVSDECCACWIIRQGFSARRDLRGGIGVFTTSTSGRALELIEGDEDDLSPRKALMVCRVIAGRVHRPVENIWEIAGQTGFDSLASRVGVHSNIEELYLLNPRALLPCFVVICKA